MPLQPNSILAARPKTRRRSTAAQASTPAPRIPAVIVTRRQGGKRRRTGARAQFPRYRGLGGKRGAIAATAKQFPRYRGLGGQNEKTVSNCLIPALMSTKSPPGGAKISSKFPEFDHKNVIRRPEITTNCLRNGGLVPRSAGINRRSNSRPLYNRSISGRWNRSMARVCDDGSGHGKRWDG